MAPLPLPGTRVGGNEYDGKNYYMRVRSTGAANIPVGYVQVIQGSTDTTKLDFFAGACLRRSSPAM
jgi:hypothetical protein